MGGLRATAFLLALGLLLSLAGSASAAPARESKLNGAQPVYEWTAPKKSSLNVTYTHTAQGQTVAAPCDERIMAYCDDTLVNVEVPDGLSGTSLVAEIPASTGTNDFDLYVYKSAASGAPGAAAGSSGQAAPNAEKVTVNNPKGFYLIRIVYFETTDAGISGKATLNGVPPPEPEPDPEPDPGPGPGPDPGPGPGPGPGGDPQPAPSPGPGPVTPAPATQQAPAGPRLRAAIRLKRARLRLARKRGLSVRASCSAACRGIVEFKVSKATARRLGLGRRTMIARARFSLPSKGRRFLRVRVSTRAKRMLARGGTRALPKGKAITLTATGRVTDPKLGQRVLVRRKTNLRR